MNANVKAIYVHGSVVGPWKTDTAPTEINQNNIGIRWAVNA